MFPPIVVAALVAVIAVSAGVWVLDEIVTAEIPAVRRYVANPFGIAILFTGIWVLVYALFQILGAKMDQDATGNSLARWLTGRRGPGIDNALRHVPTDRRVDMMADAWETIRARRASFITFGIWVLPLLGFIGTVVGISEAIGSMGNVFDGGDRTGALQEVLGGLRFAFDTTFLGLSCVIPVMAASLVLKSRSDQARESLIIKSFQET
jgi:hypothetical protein